MEIEALIYDVVDAVEKQARLRFAYSGLDNEDAVLLADRIVEIGEVKRAAISRLRHALERR